MAPEVGNMSVEAKAVQVIFTQTFDEGRCAPIEPKYILPSIPLYGVERMAGVPDKLVDEGDPLPFICMDDDGCLTHAGWLRNDDECVNQSAALRYAETDAGATRILMFGPNGWEQEIG
jgi:hypothetical protein